MRKLAILLAIAVAAIVSLLVLGFVYVDYNGHKTYLYRIYRNGVDVGNIQVDKFVTEEKIIYKTSYFTPYNLDGYRSGNQKLVLDRRELAPISFHDEAFGGRESKRLSNITQNANNTDQLYSRMPEFLALKDFDTGRKIQIFSPYGVMFYMPIMDQYNFWKKGAQFFEIMIPVDDPVPILRDKLEVWYIREDYVRFAGKRVEARQVLFRSKGMPEAIVTLSKYMHVPLSISIKRAGLKFELVRSQNTFDRLLTRIAGRYNPRFIPEDENNEKSLLPDIRKEEIFFPSRKLILSGRMWVPQGTGPFPGVVIIPDDGPMKNGDRLLFNSIAESLCQSGVVVIEPDSPGCGKSQGNFFEMTDTDREADVKACVNYMSQHPLVDPKKIDLVGRRGGSYISLLVANSCDSVRSCVLLGMPGKTAVDGAGVRWNDLQRFLRYHGLGTFNQGYMSILEKSVSENIATAKNSKEDFIFFMGNRLSAKAYKEYLDRKPYETIIRANKPLLILISREEKDYSAQAVESLQKIFSENKSASNISVLNNMPPYMGSLERTDNTVLFEVDNDLIECLKKWCK